MGSMSSPILNYTNSFEADLKGINTRVAKPLPAAIRFSLADASILQQAASAYVHSGWDSCCLRTNLWKGQSLIADTGPEPSGLQLDLRLVLSSFHKMSDWRLPASAMSTLWMGSWRLGDEADCGCFNLAGVV